MKVIGGNTCSWGVAEVEGESRVCDLSLRAMAWEY